MIVKNDHLQLQFIYELFDLDGLLCVQRRLKFKSGRDETLVFAAVVEPELFAYSSDSTYRTDVVVRKSFALSSR